MSDSVCLICSRIQMIKENVNPYFVAELETGYVVIADFQYYKGYTLFLCKEDVRELHFLDENFKLKFLHEMSQVYEAVYNAFKPIKINCELLGNRDPHIHWHIVPRYGTDQHPEGPAWLTDSSITQAETARPSVMELDLLKSKLLEKVDKTAKNIIRRYSDT